MSRQRSTYATAAQLVDLDEQLSERDRQIIRLVADLKLLSGGQLTRVFFPGGGGGRRDDQVARRTLLRLSRQGLLERLERRIGGIKAGSEGFCYRATPVGLRLIDYWNGDGLTRSRQLPEPGSRFVRHRLAVSEIAVELYEAQARGALQVATFHAEPDSWRTYLGIGASRARLKPDAFVVIHRNGFELSSFVEVDLGTVGASARVSQAAAYRAYWRSGASGGVMPRVIWVGVDLEQLRRVAGAVRPDAGPQGLFVLSTPDEAVRKLAATGEPCGRLTSLQGNGS